MKEINVYIRNLGFIPSILIVWFGMSIIYVFFWLISFKLLNGWDIIFIGDQNASLLQGPLYRTILETMIIGPLLETLIFQKSLYFIITLSNWLRHNRCWIVIIGAFVFCSVHFYTLSYVIVTFITGAFFMYMYIIKRHKHGYWSVVLIHAMINGLAIFLNLFE